MEKVQFILLSYYFSVTSAYEEVYQHRTLIYKVTAR